MKERYLAWHFLQEDRKLRFEPFTEVIPGKIIIHNGNIRMCREGLHASINVYDALQYAPGTILSRVEVSGQIEFGNDKLVASKRKCLWMVDATKVLQRFAIWCAEEALQNEVQHGRHPDKRSYSAIQAAKDYLDGKIDKNAANAAAYAATAAANAAAYAAAAYAAANAANAAAYAAFKQKANRKLEDMIKEAFPKQFKR